VGPWCSSPSPWAPSHRPNNNFFEDWLIYLEGRFFYSHFPQEITAFTAVPNPAYEVRSGVERRFYWGEAAPVFGIYPQAEFKGVGTLSGIVFEDRNHNGSFDAGDVPIKDAVLRLDDGYVVETTNQRVSQQRRSRLRLLAPRGHPLGWESASRHQNSRRADLGFSFPWLKVAPLLTEKSRVVS
jgi:hypothetical protein